jgi:hypothetical protein
LGAESLFGVFPIEARYREPQNRENEKRKEKMGRLRVPSRGERVFTIEPHFEAAKESDRWN